MQEIITPAYVNNYIEITIQNHNQISWGKCYLLSK